MGNVESSSVLVVYYILYIYSIYRLTTVSSNLLVKEMRQNGGLLTLTKAI